MNSTLKKISVAAIDNQCIKGVKDMVMVHAKKLFVKLMDWLCVRCGQITPGDLTKNQGEMQATYNIKEPIEILLDQMDMDQEFAITGNSPFS